MVDNDYEKHVLKMMKEIQKSPLYFVKVMFGLIPQPLKPEYQARFSFGLLMRDKAWDTFCLTVKPYWFMEYKDGYHMTWQQSLVLYGIEKALRKEVSNRISIVSGHGIGKSTMLAILILWFLFAFTDSQVPCTAPTASGLYDVLWKEISKWIAKLPAEYQKLYIWEAGHIRMAVRPQEWFARAKTSTKENTEALAGVHADWVLVAVDEASGVEEPIFETMEGALTSGNILVFLISNGTRSMGYFYDTHHKDSPRWQNYAFDSEQSPRVDQKYIDGIVSKYGADSIQYAIRVKGQFPNEGIMDDSGYVQLFSDKDLHFIPYDSQWKPVGRPKSALDASGEGQDESKWAVRDRMVACVVAGEKLSTPSSMAIKSITIVDKYDIDPIDFVIDNFGSGADVGMEIALATSKLKRPWRTFPINIGTQCEDPTDIAQFVNVRAMLYYKFMLWCRSGGQLMESPKLKDELLSIRFKRTSNGRIQIMDKVQMRKLGYNSPDSADSISMTFLRPDRIEPRSSLTTEMYERRANEFDPTKSCE